MVPGKRIQRRRRNRSQPDRSLSSAIRDTVHENSGGVYANIQYGTHGSDQFNNDVRHNANNDDIDVEHPPSAGDRHNTVEEDVQHDSVENIEVEDPHSAGDRENTVEEDVQHDAVEDAEFLGSGHWDFDSFLLGYSESLMFDADFLRNIEERAEQFDSDDQEAITESIHAGIVGTLTQKADAKKADTIIRTMKRKLSRVNVTAIITIYGKSRYTLKAYNHLVLLMKRFEKMPSVTTVRIRLFPYLVANNFVRSTVITLNSSAIARVKRSDDPGSTSTFRAGGNSNKTVVIYPSDWARMDVRCLHTFMELFCNRACRCCYPPGTFDCRIEGSSHVSSKSEISARPVSLWLNNDGVPIQGNVGMVCTLHTFADRCLPNAITSKKAIQFSPSYYNNEMSNSFDATIVSTYTVDFNKARDAYFSLGLPYSGQSEELHHLITTSMAYLRRFLAHDAVTRDGNDLELRVGDLLTLLTSVHDNRVDVLIIFVNNFWPSRLDDDRQYLLFMHTGSSGGLSHIVLTSFGIPRYVDIRSVTKEAHASDQGAGQCKTTGTLPSGERYYIYRVLLYADDFNARSPLFPKGSVGGVYMSPAGLSVRSRRSQASIRTVSLTPTGTSTNMVLDHIIDGLVSGSLQGVACVDPFGHKCKAFFDIMGYLADYPASTSAVDVLGHTALSPCTHCTFRCCRSLLLSKYAFTTMVSSANSSFRHTQDRTRSIQLLNISEKDTRLLGLKPGQSESLHEPGVCPLLKLCSIYNISLDQSTYQAPFNTTSLDGYNLNLIAPDHLLTGLMKGVVHWSFVHLSGENEREMLQISLKSSLLEFGYQSHNCFFKDNKIVPGLSMSMIYAIFSVLPPLLQSMDLLETLPKKDLITHMHTFLCLAFWWPSRETDGMDSWNFVLGEDKQIYNSALHKVAHNFIMAVDRYVRDYPELRRYVDRPNTHRLLELTTHTLPLYSHLLFVCELVLESAHQPLKFLLGRNHTSTAHLQSVQVILAKDWLKRLCQLWKIYSDNSRPSTERTVSMNGLMYLFVGREADKLAWDSENLLSFKKRIHDHISSVPTGTVEEILSEWYADSFMSYSVHGCWKAIDSFNIDYLPQLDRSSLCEVLKELSIVIGVPASKLSHVSRAAYHRGFGLSSINSHERIERGDFVQLLVRQKRMGQRFVTACKQGVGSLTYFVVGALITDGTNGIWLVVHMCLLQKESSSQLPDYNAPLLTPFSLPPFFTDSHVSILKLEKDVRKVGFVHNCVEDGGCTFSASTKTVRHSTTTIQGGHYYLLTRSAAYPPRRS